MSTPIDLNTLIAQHRVAFKAWCDTSDEEWDTPAATAAGDLMDAAHNALFSHRPATLEEARDKAAYMASCRSFLEWDSIEKIKLIEALTPDEAKASPQLQTATPIMTLFAEWNAMRDRSDEPGISDDEVTRRCDEADELMMRLLALRPESATDLAAKVMCFTHYGNYDLDDANGGIALMQEMAAMVGHPENLEEKYQKSRLYVHQEEGAEL